MARRPLDLRLCQNPVKQFPILGGVHILGGGTQDRHAHFDQGLRQFDGCLTAKLHHRAVRFFDLNNIFHVLGGQRLEIQLIGNIEIRTDRLGIIIDNDGLITLFGKGPGTVHGTEVKLNPLADTDGAGTQHQHFLPVTVALCLVLPAVYRIIIRCGRGKFRRAGIHHFVGGRDAVLPAEAADLLPAFPCQGSDHGIREFQPLGLPQKLLRQCFPAQGFFHLHQNRDFIDKPEINPRAPMDSLIGNIPAQGLGDTPDAHIVYDVQSL